MDRRLLLPLLVLGLSLTVGCGGCGDDAATDTTDTAGTDMSMDRADALGVDMLGEDLCGGGCQCSDGIDNDGDGTIDGMDVECTGPTDNDEGSFATGIPGDNRDPIWQDCFYDGNSGAGDDGCRYHTECLTGERDSTDPDCQVSAACLEFCRGRTPNGCDCFGCCDVTLEDGSTLSVAIGGTCSLENIEDETACPRCVPDDECVNECGTCELCPGREAADLPAECYPDDAGMPVYECEGGVTCATSADCDAGYYCSLGCCLVVII